MKRKSSHLKKMIISIFSESLSVKQKTLESNLVEIEKAVEMIVRALRQGGKIFLFGNGGSAADSQHMAAELVGRFQKERKALAAVALTTDTSILTALGNDYGFDTIFARQIEALGSAVDIAMGLSTSGNSPNVTAGLKKAKKIGMKTISLTGGKGGKIARLTDVRIIVPSVNTARVQEAHSIVTHVICDLVERTFTKS